VEKLGEFTGDRDPILDMFIFETNQLIEQLEDIMMEVENEGDIPAEHINEIFRIMHTIKGSSAMMSFDNISVVAHKIEDLFFKIRDNNSVGDGFQEVCDVVFEGTDFIKAQMERVEAGEDVTETADDLLSKIADVIKIVDGGAPAASNTEKQEETKTADETESLNVEAKKADIAIGEESDSKAGDNKFWAKIVFEADCKMEHVRAFSVINELDKYCKEVISKPKELFDDPTSADYIAANGLELWFSTGLNQSKIEKVLATQICVKSIEVKPINEFPNEINKNNDEEQRENVNKEIEAAQKEEEAAPKAEVKKSVSTENKVVKKPSAEQSKKTPNKATSTVKQNLINVNVDKLDSLLDFVGEIVIAQSMVVQNPEIRGLDLPNFTKSAEQLEKLTKDLQDVVMAIRMVPIAAVFHKMNRIVRDMSKTLNKDVELVISGEETEVDKTIIDSLSDPLMHMVRNCMDHGLETKEERAKTNKPPKGQVALRAFNDGSNVVVTVSDDGKGLARDKILQKAINNGLLPADDDNIPDKKIFECILLPGFSTKEKVTEFSGRGVGMDVVKQNIETIGGSVSIDSKQGMGTVFTIKIPLTLAIIDGMNVAVGNNCFIVPITSISDVFRTRAENITRDPYGNERIHLNGKFCDIIRLHEKYNIETDVKNIDDGVLITVKNDNKTVCLFVDSIIGEQQIVIKPLPKYLKYIIKDESGISGCTILGDGSIGFILNTNELK
jgi:two-component system chemotaxis sensor kinase CheA